MAAISANRLYDAPDLQRFYEAICHRDLYAHISRQSLRRYRFHPLDGLHACIFLYCHCKSLLLLWLWRLFLIVCRLDFGPTWTCLSTFVTRGPWLFLVTAHVLPMSLSPLIFIRKKVKT